MKINEYKLYSNDNENKAKVIPVLLSKIQAGSPFPFEDFIEEKIDLNTLLISNPTSTYFMKVEKSSSVNNEIIPGSLLIVDRDKDPKNMDIVVAAHKGELYISRIKIKKDLETFFETSRGKKVTMASDTEIWGVVIYSIFTV